MKLKEWDNIDSILHDFLLPAVSRSFLIGDLSEYEKIECTNRFRLYNFNRDRDWQVNPDNDLYRSINFEGIIVYFSNLHRSIFKYNNSELGNGIISYDQYGNSAKLYFTSPLGTLSENCPLIGGLEKDLSGVEEIITRINQYFNQHPVVHDATEIRANLVMQDQSAPRVLKRK